MKRMRTTVGLIMIAMLIVLLQPLAGRRQRSRVGPLFATGVLSKSSGRIFEME